MGYNIIEPITLGPELQAFHSTIRLAPSLHLCLISRQTDHKVGWPPQKVFPSSLNFKEKIRVCGLVKKNQGSHNGEGKIRVHILVKGKN